MSNKKALIIGGAGFIGRNLTDYLIDNFDYEITLIDNFLSSNQFMVRVDSKITLIEGDAGNLELYKNLQTDFDEVYLLHCLHGNQSSIYDPISDLNNTLKPTIVVFEWLRQTHSKASIVYAGAGCAVAEKTWDQPTGVEETDVINLNHDSPYSISKLTGEMHAQFYSKQFNLNIKRARFQNVYGPGEYLGAGVWRGTEATIWRNVTPSFIWQALNNEKLVVTGQTAARDFIFVRDLVRGLHLVANRGSLGNAYNLASGTETNIFTWAQLIIDILKSESIIEVRAARDWDNSGRRFGNTAKSKKELGFEISTNVTHGLIQTIKWIELHKATMKDLIENHSNYL